MAVGFALVALNVLLLVLLICSEVWARVNIEKFKAERAILHERLETCRKYQNGLLADKALLSAKNVGLESENEAYAKRIEEDQSVQLAENRRLRAMLKKHNDLFDLIKEQSE